MQRGVEIKFIDFDIVEHVWKNHLWPNNAGHYKQMSAMQLDGTKDISVYTKYTPIFLGAFIDGKLAGVNSGHLSSDTEFRSRGLYVFKEYRKKGIATQLLKQTIRAGLTKASCVWSYPNIKAIKAYHRAGFVFYREDTDTNLYVICKRT